MLFFLILLVVLQAEELCVFNQRPISVLQFEGLEVTQPLVVQRELIHQEGQVFNCENAELEKNRLHSLGIFSEVSLVINPEKDSLQLHYVFKELPAFVVVPNISLTDQEGLLMGVSLVGLNLMGLDLSSQLSWRTNTYPEFNTATEYFASFSSRWLGEMPLEWLIFGGRTDSYNSLKEFEERSWRTELHLNYRLFGPWALRIYGGHLQIEHTQSAGFFEVGDQDIWFSLGGGLRYDTRDNPNQVHNGLFTELEVIPHYYLNSDYQHVLYRADLRFYKSWGSHTFHPSTLLRMRKGDVAFYDLYNVGGANSLRGYVPEKSRQAQSEWIRTLEYRYLFFENSTFQMPWLGWNLYWGLQGVLGVDWNSLYDQTGSEKQYSAPFVGIHILLPGIQRLRLEIGAKSWGAQLQFALGLYEKSTTQNWRTR